MIYTVTFNPSLDYIVSVEDFKLGMTNRTSAELILPGGKGINVSTVLKNLGIQSIALGFTAGFVGDEIRRRVEALGVSSNFITVNEGVSRINVKLKSIDGTEINGQGPAIGQEHVAELLNRLELLGEGDILFLSGSIPVSVPDDIYRRIMERLKPRSIRCVVDATGDLLVNVLEHRPFLIKPNQYELGEIFGREFQTRDEVIPYAVRLQDMGARNVLVSMGADGAVLLTADGKIFSETAPVGKLINSVGAGDSMAAGFVAGYLDGADYLHAFRMGLAAGSASAFSEYLATREEIETVYGQILQGEGEPCEYDALAGR